MSISKKSQMELFGLAIVVVIIILATLFIAVLYLNKKPSETRKSFVESELASGMINTLINVDVGNEDGNGCQKIRMSDLIRICNSGGASPCSSSKPTCEIVETSIRAIFDSSIDEWTASKGKPDAEKRYYFSIYSNPSIPSLEIGHKCSGDKKFKEYIIPGASPIRVNLELCS